MTTYHLKFWAKNSGKTSNPLIAALELERIYVNADDRSSLGYIERRTASKERGNETYYDRQRAAKGDTTDIESDVITCTVPAGAMEKIIAAMTAVEPYGFVAKYSGGLYTDMGLYQAAKEFTRGIDWIGGRGKSLKKLAASFTVEI